jgi:RNA ligase (TIGR02306 family)
MLPEDNPHFDFLKNSKGKIKALKPKRIRGIVSQGLVMPIDILNNYDGSMEEETDLTEFLKVKKREEVEIPFYKQGKVFSVSTFPAFVQKTDETRIQVLQKQLTESKGHSFVVTEKLDGTSFTAFIREGKFGICSRNMEVRLDVPSPYSEVALDNDLENKFKELRENVIPYDFAIQGEIIGNGIQGNKYKLKGFECRLFNFFNIDKQKDIGFYIGDGKEFDDFHGFTLGQVAALLEMQTVPILDSDFKMTDDIDTLVEYAKGNSVLNPETVREGVVFRLKNNNALSRYGERYSFKSINPDFLCPL